LFLLWIYTCNPETGLKEAKDVSSATTKEVRVKGPDPLTTTVHTADFYTDGTDGFIMARANAAELSVASKDWQVQGFVDLPAEGPFSSDVERFEVEENI